MQTYVIEKGATIKIDGHPYVVEEDVKVGGTMPPSTPPREGFSCRDESGAN